ncbi:SDR family oxidoreductase [Caballeronia sp. SEWSISQ10-4 2]|uniref:SDR family oxidoreductase n=1 Tax=Caballeronia sp. SEWSISQ10-4 2 TaxID=2937438 RepID=UPI0026570D32|nr:SDR family oxidoreductase [Caballeronia sp. SEWSISQ10-4 2]MDN7181367.1 SDR family oxidoreductase [Caballeronia sp. SEWSISQ10-4 2]
MSKVWFITGAGSGIGANAAKAALAAGDRVVATARNIPKLRNALGDATHDNLALLQLDVSDEAQATTAIEQAVNRFGRIDVVLNNAGYSLLGNYEELETQDIQRLFATNFWGVSNVMRAALPVMRKQRSGHIINISSVAGAVGMMHCGAYSASKFAVEGLSLAVAEEVGKFGIKVTVVEPGFFRTDLLDVANVRWPNTRIDDYAAAEVSAQEMWSPYAGKQPGDPEKLGQVLVKLADMEIPPRMFVAGSDAIAAVAPVVEARLKAVYALEELSKSTDGSF